MAGFDQDEDLDVFEEVEPRPVASLLPAPNAYGAERFVTWLRQGFELFNRSFILWLIISAVYLLGSMLVVSFALYVLTRFLPIAIPLVPSAFFVLGWMFMGSLIAGCAIVDRDEELEIDQLFAGFRSHGKQLALVGCACLAVLLLVCLSLGAALYVAKGVVTAVHWIFGNEMLIEAVLAAIAVAVLGMVALAALLTVLWAAQLAFLALPLVMLHDHSAREALLLSFKGWLRNWKPLALLCLVFTGISLLTGGTLFLGMIVWLPIVANSIYSAYKDIYVAPSEVSRPLNI